MSDINLYVYITKQDRIFFKVKLYLEGKKRKKWQMEKKKKDRQKEKKVIQKRRRTDGKKTSQQKKKTERPIKDRQLRKIIE